MILAGIDLILGRSDLTGIYEDFDVVMSAGIDLKLECIDLAGIDGDFDVVILAGIDGNQGVVI